MFYSVQNSLNLKVLFNIFFYNYWPSAKFQFKFKDELLESNPNWRGIGKKSTKWVQKIYAHLDWGSVKSEFYKTTMNLAGENVRNMNDLPFEYVYQDKLTRSTFDGVMW